MSAEYFLVADTTTVKLIEGAFRAASRVSKLAGPVKMKIDEDKVGEMSRLKIARTIEQLEKDNKVIIKGEKGSVSVWRLVPE